MDRYTRIEQPRKPGDDYTAYNWKMIDRFGRDPMGYTYSLSGAREPLCHTAIDSKARVKRLNRGHLRAWIETNYKQVVIEFKAKNLTVTVPWSFKAWMRARYPHLLKRFADFNEYQIKKYEA